MIPLDKIRSSQRNAGMVKRYHEYPTHHIQTNAEHSWHVARIWLQVFGGDLRSHHCNVLTYILYHDMGELGVGDLPFPTKSNNPALKDEFDIMEKDSLKKQGVTMPDLSTWDKKSVKVCDLLEMAEFGQEERRFGSEYGQSIVDVTLAKVREMLMGFTSGEVMSIKIFVRDQLGVQL